MYSRYIVGWILGTVRFTPVQLRIFPVKLSVFSDSWVYPSTVGCNPGKVECILGTVGFTPVQLNVFPVKLGVFPVQLGVFSVQFSVFLVLLVYGNQAQASCHYDSKFFFLG